MAVGMDWVLAENYGCGSFAWTEIEFKQVIPAMAAEKMMEEVFTGTDFVGKRGEVISSRTLHLSNGFGL
jgi:hypothetical protein